VTPFYELIQQHKNTATAYFSFIASSEKLFCSFILW